MKYTNFNQSFRRNNFESFRKDFNFLLFFVLSLTCFTALSQNKNERGNGESVSQIFKTISFGSKNDFGDFKNSENWIITNTQDNIVTSLSGNQINDYVFEKPGMYQIRFVESKNNNRNGHDEEDHHSRFSEKINIRVSPVKMRFDFSKIKFSQKIQKGKSCDEIMISVPVEITIKGSTSVRLKTPELKIAGLGSDLIAKSIRAEIVIANGVQVLNYKLSGTVNQESYLMFDFYDFNNQVQTYNLLEIIK